MTALKAMGYVSHQAGRPRTAVLRMPGPDDAGPKAAAVGDGRIAEVPLVGRIAAGTPVIADQLAELAEDVIPVPRMLTGEGNLVALRVAGDSMIEAAVADGDWVIVREQPDADSGDMVAAMLASEVSADYEATVKTLTKAVAGVAVAAWLVRVVIAVAMARRSAAAARAEAALIASRCPARATRHSRGLGAAATSCPFGLWRPGWPGQATVPGRSRCQP
jgi:SOS-response transcriptional repressor LexA